MQLLDSEILEIEKVLKALKVKEGTLGNLESFRKESIERFGQIGWKVDVECYYTDVGAIAFDLTIVDRCEPLRDGFDYERMQHEVVNDLLEIAPELKGETIPFSEAMVHNPDLAQG